jgi:hypothetical protein
MAREAVATADGEECRALLNATRPQCQQLTRPKWSTYFEPVPPHNPSSGWHEAHLCEVQRIGSSRIRTEAP